jgi:beta-glucanase (GH16 family)
MQLPQAESRLVVTGVLCLAITGLLVAAPATAQVPNLPGWDLVWNDEFDTGVLDTARWEALNRKDSFNNEKQYYLPDQVSVSNGLLTITATDQPLAGKPYRSGLVRTWDEQTYGRWEIRADLPSTQGMWPAIWLLPKTVSWPLGGEIDIMENRGSQPNLVSSAYHWNTVPNSSNFVFNEYSATDGGGQPVNFQTGMHTYAVEWEADQIRYYVDDNLHFTVNNPQAPLTVPMSLIINLAVGGNFGGDPDATTVFPQNFDVDYVRVWQRPSQLPGDVNGDGFVGIADLNIVLGNWNASAAPDPGVLISDFGNFNLTGTYSQWNTGTFTSAPNDFTVQANDFGGGWYDLPAPIDATGETTLRLNLDVNPANTADALNIVLIDADGTERVYRFDNLTVGDDQTLSIDLANFLQDNAVGSVPGLDLSSLTVFHAQGTFANGNPGLPMDLTFDNLSIGSGATVLLQGDLDGDGFVGITDLNTILGNWNAGTPPATSVPEPASILITGIVTTAMLTRRRT